MWRAQSKNTGSRYKADERRRRLCSDSHYSRNQGPPDCLAECCYQYERYLRSIRVIVYQYIYMCLILIWQFLLLAGIYLHIFAILLSRLCRRDARAKTGPCSPVLNATHANLMSGMANSCLHFLRSTTVLSSSSLWPIVAAGGVWFARPSLPNRGGLGLFVSTL